jgi:hypothetical protein
MQMEIKWTCSRKMQTERQLADAGRPGLLSRA